MRSRMSIPSSKTIELIIKCDNNKKDFLLAHLELFKNFTKMQFYNN